MIEDGWIVVVQAERPKTRKMDTVKEDMKIVDERKEDEDIRGR